MYDSTLEKDLSEYVQNYFNNILNFKIVNKVSGKIMLSQSYSPDMFFSIKVASSEIPVVVEIVGQTNHLTKLRGFKEFLKQFDGIGIVVSSVIDERIKSELRKNEIGYIEEGGESFVPLRLGTSLLKSRNKGGNRAVKKQGFKADSTLKTILYFLMNPMSMNSLTQRELADRLSLSPGAINLSIRKLRERKLLIRRGSEYCFGRFERIIEYLRMALYSAKRKGLSLGRFSSFDDELWSNWNNRDLKKIDCYWAGEPAASIRTGYLTPEFFEIYSYNDKVVPLMKELKLKKDENGKVEVFKAFWPEEFNNSDATVFDIITYCDLLESGIDRNIETAKMLEHEIRDRIEKYGI
ncbi:type IV toxin-antitoxin system AbiEi family antitoxin [Halobacteriovorax sp. RZ-1]|uniref:type IV toxin-antitoxin system AbiEi family antitoxin n=1 Tax=unclassified Halobacteriovorax TaxID=2639665 RepID=UPI00370FB8C8